MTPRVPTNTAARATPGVRRGAVAPARSIPIVLDALPDGRVRLSSPLAANFVAVARTPHEMWRALRSVMTEAQVAGYAAWRGQHYDHDTRVPVRHQPPVAAVSWEKGAVCRPDATHPAEWSPNEDGTWTSPSGRTYRSPRMIDRLVEKRAALGLPTCYADEQLAERRESMGLMGRTA